ILTMPLRFLHVSVQVFCPFKNSIVFILLNFKSSLYILDTSPLLNMSFATFTAALTAPFSFLFPSPFPLFIPSSPSRSLLSPLLSLSSPSFSSGPPLLHLLSFSPSLIFHLLQVTALISLFK
uniref:Uncharacterized protein n=1 Tax=Bos mutus grunniens TaxID=30521 RepID=A0A8C0A3E8_BOSMU